MIQTDRWRAVRPLGQRDYRLLFAAVVLSVFAAGMWSVVMVYAVIDIGGGPLQLSLVATANAVGLLLCAIPGGITADRVSRRTIVRLVELVNALAVATVVGAGALGVLTVAHLAAVAFVLGAGAGFFFPAYSAFLPRILPETQLLAANGLEQATRPALQQAAGPAAAGFLVAALFPAQAALFVALAYGIAFVVLLFLRPEPAVPVGETAPTAGVWHDLREAVGFTVRTPWLLWTLLFSTIWVLISLGPEIVLLPFVVAERIGDDPRLYGFLLAAFGIGGVVGSLAASGFRLPRRYLTAMMAIWSVSTLPFAVLGYTDDYVLMLISCLLSGAAFSYGNVIWGTLLQRRVPRRMLGRVSSLDYFVSLALMPLSMALAGPAGEVLPLPTIFLAAALVPLVCGIAAYVIARMPRDEITHPLESA